MLLHRQRSKSEDGGQIGPKPGPQPVVWVNFSKASLQVDPDAEARVRSRLWSMTAGFCEEGDALASSTKQIRGRRAE